MDLAQISAHQGDEGEVYDVVIARLVSTLPTFYVGTFAFRRLTLWRQSMDKQTDIRGTLDELRLLLNG